MLELDCMEVLKKIKTIITTALSKLIDCIVPALPIMIGVGMLNVIFSILISQVGVDVIFRNNKNHLVSI